MQPARLYTAMTETRKVRIFYYYHNHNILQYPYEVFYSSKCGEDTSQNSQVRQAKEILRVLSHHSRLLSSPSFKSSCFLELTRQHSTRHTTSVIRPSSPTLPSERPGHFLGRHPRPPARGPSDGPLVFGPVPQSQGCLAREEGREREVDRLQRRRRRRVK